MADNADIAQVEIERQEARLLTQRARTAPVGQVSASECQECGLEIPGARQIAIPGTQHCAECAAILFEGRGGR